MNRRLRTWGAVWLAWTALALFFAVSASLTYRSTGRPANWTLSIERSLIEWWLWALFTPLVAWLARRFSLDRARIWRNASVHLGAGIVIAFFKMSAERAAFAWLTGIWMYWLVSTLALQFSIYCAIVAAAHGLIYFERSRERDHLEARLAEARLQLLSMQLQPHFLFNTLNTIAELVHDDADAADRMITGLSDLLRRTLELGPTQEIALGAELELLEQYLDIQRARFGDRLQVTFAVGDETRRARCRCCSCNRSSKTRFATGWASGWPLAMWTSPRAATAAGSSSRCRMMARGRRTVDDARTRRPRQHACAAGGALRCRPAAALVDGATAGRPRHARDSRSRHAAAVAAS